MSERAHEITNLMRQIGMAQRRAMINWMSTTGLTAEQGRALGFIEAKQADGLIAREIAEVTGRTPASVTSLLQGLEDQGLIQRTPSPADARRKLLSVTELGQRWVDDFEAKMRAADASVYNCLTDDEQAQLIALLTRVVDTSGD